MFRHRIAVDEGSGVDTAIADLRSKLDRSDVDISARALAVAESELVLRSFVENGQKLASHGSQFQATRELKGAGYSIKIEFAPRASKGWIARLLGR